MTIKAAFWPMSGKREVCPYNPNQKLLDIRPSSTSAVSGSIEILADGRFKLELEAAGGAGSGLARPEYLGGRRFRCGNCG